MPCRQIMRRKPASCQRNLGQRDKPSGSYIEYISPTPLLLVVAAKDHLTVADEAIAAYERALEPQKLVLLKGGHFDAYVKSFDEASGAARDWFVEHLTGGG